MKQFFKFTLASLAGFVIAGILFVSIATGIFTSLVSSTNTPPKIEENAVLLIKFDKAVYDREVSDLSSLSDVFGGDMGASMGLTEFMEVLNKAKTDSKVKALMLDLSILQTNGWATVEEMRQALIDFKSSGKKVYAYSDMFTQSAYYLASAADEVVLNPAGMLTLTGLGAEVMYYKDLLDKFDVDVDLIRPRNNAYKSAGERYIKNKMSDENREQIKVYLNAIWDYAAENMAKSRHLDVTVLNKMVSSLDVCLPEDALRNTLVDKLSFRSDVQDLICEEVRTKYKLGKKTKVSFVKYSDYRKTMPDIFLPQKENIAVVYAFGDVNRGKGSELSIGSETIVKALQKAAANKRVKAIVLRVNSPGGDAVASELITNEVIKAKKKKPVIVSMGDVAASAGYEMSSNATKIVASPITITGSIGVFGVMPNFARSLKKNLGITFDTVKTHNNSIALTVTSPVSQDVKSMMQRNVENFYDNFITRVATGRQKDKAYIDSIARGRVWAGSQAKDLGLVDEFGGLKKAVELAAKEAGIKGAYGIVAYPKTKDLTTQIMEAFSGEARLKSFAEQLGKPYSFFLELRNVCMMQGVQARMPYLIDF